MAKKPMTDERFKEIERLYRKAVKTIRECLDFEGMTFQYHPDADDARREVASLVPELLTELRRFRRGG